MRRLALAVALAALVLPAAAAAFVPADPLVAKQWYLAQDHAFDFWPDAQPVLASVKVAVVDSGIDLGHPEFAGKIVAARSFVGGDAADHEGHGTFVAGEIAAAVGNGAGIAGLAFNAQLLIAKVTSPDGTISPDAEARGIRWAVAHGARVVNLSIGGLRDPLDPARDTFSPEEEAAVEYATAHGALVVAAVGNADQSPRTPWNYASYPAALPHVLGVGALGQDGVVSSFSNRDPVFVDLAAPGVGIVSTLPRSLTASHPACVDQGYSDCGPADFRDAEGTSFAAPQVAAAAALILGTRPTLAPDQVASILELSAADIGAPGHDPFSGSGALDVTAALQAAQVTPPPADRLEPNDDAGTGAFTLWGSARSVAATIDYYNDPRDVYRVHLAAGETISVTLRGPAGTDTNLVLWRPGTLHVTGPTAALLPFRATQSAGAGPNERLTYRAAAGGWYYLEVRAASAGSGLYDLRFAKSPAG